MGALPVAWGVVEGKLVVLNVGAQAGGLRPGDVVARIDGRRALDVLAEAARHESASTPQFLEWRALTSLLYGALDHRVRLAVERAGAAPFEVTLVRAPGRPAVETERRPAAVAELEPGVWYVDLGRAKGPEIAAALPNLAAGRAVIFDLRGYPAGPPDFLTHLADHALQSARFGVPIITHPDRKGWSFDDSGRWNLSPAAPRIGGKVAFLTDGRAVSYAESILGIVEAYHLGEIVGGPTAGTNGNVNPFTVPGGYRIFWTGMRVLKHDGSRHHGIGIQATLPVARTIAGVAAGRDEVLERACRAVGGVHCAVAGAP